MNQMNDGSTFATLFPLLLIAVVIYFMFSQFKIAQKLRHPNAWFAFVPILNTVQLIQLANKPMVWFVFLLIPIVNVICFFILWMEVAKAVGQAAWVGFMTMIPPISLITIGMMAFGGSSNSNYNSPSSTPRQPTSVG